MSKRRPTPVVALAAELAAERVEAVVDGVLGVVEQGSATESVGTQ